MSDDFDSSPVEFGNKSYIGTVDDRTNRIMQPDRPESGVRINRMAVFGIFCCLFLTLLGLGANLYFVINNTRDCATETRAMGVQFAQQSPPTSNEDQLDANLTLSDETGPLETAAKIGEVAKSVYSLQAKFDKWENDNRHAVSSQYEHTAQKIDFIFQSMKSLSSTTDAMQKKLDKVDASVVQSRNAISDLNTTVFFMDLKSNDDIINHLDTLENALLSNGKRREDNVQTMTDIISNVTSGLLNQTQSHRQVELTNQNIDSLSKAVDTLEKKIDQININVGTTENLLTELNGSVHEMVFESIKEVETIVLSNQDLAKNNANELKELSNQKSNDDIINHLDTLENALLSNGKRREDNVQTMTDIISNVTSGLLNQTQCHRQVELTNQNIDSLSKAVDTLEKKIDQININVGTTENLLTELNGSVHEMVFESIKEVETIVLSNQDLAKNNANELKELSNQTIKILYELKDNTKAGFEDVTDSQQIFFQILGLVTKDLNETRATLDEHFKTTIAKEQIQIDILENTTVEIDVLKLTLNKLGTYSVPFNQSLSKQTSTLAALNSTFTAVVENQITERRFYLEMLEAGLLNISSKISLKSGDRQCIDQSPIEIPKPIISMLDTIHSSLTSIELSVTLNSSKQEDLTLSSAVLTLLEQTSTVHEAIMNASNQQPTCGNDGCFVKVIPVGLPASTTFVQKENVRLANAQISSGSIGGRLEVYLSNSWGTVCDDSFEAVDARVVCRMFGYSSGQQKIKAFFGQGVDPIQMDDVQCSGSESSIFSCSHVTSHNCAHGEDVGVICT